MLEFNLIRELQDRRKDRKTKLNESRQYKLSAGRSVAYQSGAEREWWDKFTESLQKGHIKTSEFSVQRLFEAVCPDAHECMRDWRTSPDGGGPSFVEAAGAVAYADFSNITGQVLYTRMMQDLTEEEMRFQTLFPNQPTQFDGEKIPGIAGLGDVAEVVDELKPYPEMGVTEDWIETPKTTKRGFTVPVTKEAIFFDRTGMLLSKAGAVGKSLTLNKEKRAIDCLIDENTTAHRYKWRGTVYASYQTASPWDNVTASNQLLDWTDIDAANQTLNAIVDPNTGEPVVIERDTLICTKQLEATATYIRNATSVEQANPGYATSGNPVVSHGASPVPMNFEIVTSRQLAARMATDTTYYYGDPRGYAVYMENWPITVTQAPPNSEAEFRRDIVTQYKASERGQYAVIEPRKITKCTVAA